MAQTCYIIYIWALSALGAALNRMGYCDMNRKKLMALLLALAVCLPLLCGRTDAAYNATYTWTLTEDGTLTVRGVAGSSGDMGDLGVSNPWGKYKDKILRVELYGPLYNIGSGAFYYCKNLESVSLCEGIQYIDPNAFSSCTSLKRVTLPASLRAVNEAFAGCTALEEINFTSASDGHTVELLGGAFSSCTALKSLTLPGNLSQLYSYSFSGCTSLTSVSVPTGVTTFNCDAFQSCTALKEITFQGAVPQNVYDSFKGCADDLTVRFDCRYADSFTADPDTGLWHGARLAAVHTPIYHKAQEATCTKAGWAAYETCSRCSYTTYQEIPAGHTPVTAPAVAPTVGIDGQTEGSRCERCGTVLTAQTVIPAWITAASCENGTLTLRLSEHAGGQLVLAAYCGGQMMQAYFPEPSDGVCTLSVEVADSFTWKAFFLTDDHTPAQYAYDLSF